MEKILTIAIAAYNKEDLLSRCLDSILIDSELMSLVQVLVVNDGSTDRTLEIAKEYEIKYPCYIYAIDQTNGNYGKVMNHALTLAEGKYFRTLDADDWYDKDAFTKFIMKLRDCDADMIITERADYNAVTGEKHLFSLDCIETGKDLEIKKITHKLNRVLNCFNVPNITYKTSLIRKSGLKWLEGICYTDTMFDVWPLPYVNTIRFEKIPVYIYYVGMQEQSMSETSLRKNFPHFVKIAEALIPYYKKYRDSNTFTEILFDRFLDQIYNNIYVNLLKDDSLLKEVVSAHRLLDCIPEYQQRQIDKRLYHKVKFLRYIKEGTLPYKFRILRGIKNIKIKIFGL